MSLRSTIVFMRLAIFFFLAGGPFAAFCAGLFSTLVVPIVLVGALVLSVPLGLVLARALRSGREEEFMARCRKHEWAFFVAAVVSQVGLIVAWPGRGPMGSLGVILSAGGMLAAFGLLVRLAAMEGQRDGQVLAPVDPGRRLD
jgi:hypothetical protein